MTYALLVFNILLMSSGQLLFKKSADFISLHNGLRFPMTYITNPWFYMAIFVYILSTFIWTQILTKMSLSVAYPIMSLAYILTVFGAYVFFHEYIGIKTILGVVLIMVGVSLAIA